MIRRYSTKRSDNTFNEEEDIMIPAFVAGEGKAIMAAYLRAHGIRKKDIASVLGVSRSTISQYLADVKNGRR